VYGKGRLNKGENWDAGIKLAQDAISYEMTCEPETEHTFKITTKDTAGNESTGVITSIRLPALPQSGPLSLILIGSGFLLAGARGMRKKK
jgi:hypothetical protein